MYWVDLKDAFEIHSTQIHSFYVPLEYFKCDENWTMIPFKERVLTKYGSLLTRKTFLPSLKNLLCLFVCFSYMVSDMVSRHFTLKEKEKNEIMTGKEVRKLIKRVDKKVPHRWLDVNQWKRPSNIGI